MTNINFDEPSVGEVTADNKPALRIINKGASAKPLEGQTAIAVVGESATGVGVQGKSDEFFAVVGQSNKGHGVFGHSQTNFGVMAGSDKGIALFASVDGINSKTAGSFLGNVEVKGDIGVSGDIRLLNADCAEDFDLSDSEIKENVEPGTVMILTEKGSLESSYQEYDKKVAGIISGASGYKPAIILDRQDQDKTNNDRLPIALMGKVYCKVDARHSSIEIGDLLTI
jgi:hypothetical protein